jgi:hypothetical protein
MSGRCRPAPLSGHSFVAASRGAEMPSNRRNLRKDWQDFKKDHPDFEKHKNFKSDVGPQIDKYIKATDEVDKAVAELTKQVRDMFKQAASITAALKGYEKVVKQVKAQDKTIEDDFRKLNFDDFDQSAWVEQYRWIQKVLLG